MRGFVTYGNPQTTSNILEPHGAFTHIQHCIPTCERFRDNFSSFVKYRVCVNPVEPARAFQIGRTTPLKYWYTDKTILR